MKLNEETISEMANFLKETKSQCEDLKQEVDDIEMLFVENGYKTNIKYEKRSSFYSPSFGTRFTNSVFYIIRFEDECSMNISSLSEEQMPNIEVEFSPHISWHPRSKSRSPILIKEETKLLNKNLSRVDTFPCDNLFTPAKRPAPPAFSPHYYKLMKK